MTYDEMLALPVDTYDAGPDMTIRKYLRELLTRLWREGECFSGKRPFGNSGWEFDLYIPLIRASVVEGKLDEDGWLKECDDKLANTIIQELIHHIFEEKK